MDGLPAHGSRTFATYRADLWWLYPLSMVIILGGFVAFATWRVFENNYYIADGEAAFLSHGVSGLGYHYVSPFAAPDLTAFVPGFMLSIPLLGQYMAYPAFLILPFPAGFRFTCYYYRKAYYRAFVSRPAGCTTEAWKGIRYRGEKRLMIINNLHRYFLYAALIITLFLAWEAIRSIWTPHGLYLGIGSVLMVVNVVFLAAYTLGCHSLRHLVGGRLDCFSCSALAQNQHTVWKGVSHLNSKHGRWAMLSLFSVALTDLYIRYVAMHPGSIAGLPA